MSARSKVSASDDQNLSLTGSQISTSLRKSSSAKQLHNIGTTPVTGSELKSTSKSGNGSRKKMPSFSSNAVPLSNRSEMSDISSVSQQKSRRSTGRSPGEDFMALFENTMQPKIKKPSSKSKKPSPNAVKVLWNPSNKGDGVDSQRSLLSQTPDSERDDLLTTPKHHNFFNPPGGSSSDEEQDEMAKILSSSLSKLNAIQKKAMEEASKRSKQNKDSNSKLPSKNFLSHSQQSGINGIANNMVTNVKTPKTKASFSTLENSYQNIRHKTPVNQVKEEQLNHKPQNKIGQDYSDSKYGIAASKIQRWYLQLKKRKQEKEMVRPEPSRKAGEAAIKRLLQQKKEEFEDHRLNLDFLSEGENEKSKAEDRKKMREEKARQARQEAIKDLQKKREEKKEESKRKAEEEISFLQANGKITKHPMKSNIGRKKHSREDKQKKDSNMEVQSVSDGGHQSSRSNLTGQPDEVDEFIESLSNVQNLSSGRNSEGGHTDRSNTLVNTEVTTKSTLNDLLSTLKKLEEEEHFLTPKAEKKTAWYEIEKDLEQGTDSRRETTLTEDRLQEMNSRQGDETSEKMQSIINFLDEVQTAERLSAVDQEISKISVADFEIPPPLVPSVDELADIEEASAAANEVTTSMLKQRLELEEKKRTVTMLQKALNQQRELTVRHARETEKEMKKRLDVQKDEYEEAIKRHLSFIDQLIDDKKTLGEKCEVLVRELKTVDKKYQDKLKGMEERHNVDLQKIKDMHEAAEKLRRERWIEDKTKKIKEMTVKGLEPEIQRLIAKHKSEVKKIKQIHEAELLESDERAAQRYVKMTEELREQLAHEKEAACARERELAKSRYEKELQNEEQAYQQQRRRLYQEVQEEKDRVAQQASRQRRELDSLQRQMEEAHRQAISAMKSEFDKAREEQENRHMTETRELKEKLKLEKEAFEENFMKKQDNWLLQKERELKEKVKKERDKEIELVINRLEEDATMSREETDRAAENKIKRLREKYDAEIKDLERSEMQALERYNDMKARLTEVEGENECMKVYLKQKDQEIEQLKKLTDKMHKERDRVSDIIRQEFADRLVATDEENKRIKNEISELKARHRIELDRMKDQIEEVRRQKDDEMEEVHKRVKQAIVKKEEVVNELKQQYQAAQKRADHLEGLLQQQRKQLLKK